MCPQPRKEERDYFLFGVLCGLALYHQNMVHLPFPLVLFKKLLRVKPVLEDLREFDPVRGEYVLEMHSGIKPVVFCFFFLFLSQMSSDIAPFSPLQVFALLAGLQPRGGRKPGCYFYSILIFI